MGKTIVISDVHFGYEESTLRNKIYCDLFINKLREIENINQIILLGDIFEFMLCGYKQAINESKYFFNQILQLDSLKKIVYIPGNHDHSFYWQHILFNQLIIPVDQDNQLHNKDLLFLDSYTNKGNRNFLRFMFNNKDVELKYPIHKEEINGKKYLFFHGHFFDHLQTLQGDLIQAIIGKIQKPNLDQLCILNAGQYETLTILGQCHIGRNKMKNIMEKMEKSKFKKLFLNFFGINSKHPEKYAHEIEGFLRDFCGKWEEIYPNNVYDVLDYFIFGHTHKANIGTFTLSDNKKKSYSINTGCWFPQGNRQIIGNFLLIDEDKSHPVLYKFKKDG
ncbi:metallophosphoesterase, partial [Candidatus Sumerlaeota bacterium]|nr:metallophosphoesterase [Candidatus Sumerlaeota bacterium]